MSAPDVVIVGGGAIGLGIAWRSARLGLDVVVADPDPGKGASWAAAGLLAPITEVHPGEEDLLRLNLFSAARYGPWIEELEGASGTSVGYRRSGTLLVARDADENAQLEEVHRLQLDLGLEAKRLKSRDCREIEPSLAPTVRGGILVADDHQIDNRALVSALLDACVAQGVSFARAKVAAVLGEDVVGGVLLDDGERISAPSVVLATGASLNAIDGVARDVLPPIRPVKGQLLHLRARGVAPVPEHVVRGVDVYIVPRADGRLVVGATMEEQGFDRTITAGAVHTLLRDAYELVPAIAETELTEVTAGLRPATPDNSPVIGPTRVKGLVAATGHFRNGILLTPATADLVASLLADGRIPEELAPFSPARFDEKVGAA